MFHMIDIKCEREKLTRTGEFEHELLNRRVTWLLTSQTILFAAYGLSLGGEDHKTLAIKFQQHIPSLGVYIAVVILVGIFAALLAKIVARNDYNIKVRKYKLNAFVEGKESAEEVELGVRTWITLIGYIPDICLPLLFIYTWSKL